MNRKAFGSRIGGATTKLLAVACLALAPWLACAPAWAGTPANKASDICASNANPCNVTAIFDIENNSTLDFGTRAVNVSGSGQFNFANGSGKILCGPFTANTSGAAIDANGLAVGGGTESGIVSLSARRQCSMGSPEPACIDGNDCDLGSCTARRCTLKPAKVCLSGADCQLGVCGANRRCSGAVGIVRCATNADCDYGTCPAQLTCSDRAENPLNCASNVDCDFGACSGGVASITMGGSIVGNSNSPASIILRAADDVVISKLINVNGSIGDSDGGSLAIEAAAGSVTMTAKVTATGGGLSQGGSVEIYGGTDVTINETIDVTGGDFDGGSLDVTSGRDITLNRSVMANSGSGAGFGGEVFVAAGRDLTVNGVSSVNKTTLETNGHTSIESFAGDGGTQDLSAGRHLLLNVNTRMLGTGSQPDGTGSDFFLDAAGDLTLAGDITASATGSVGGGGFVEILSAGTFTVSSSGTMDATGGGGGGGDVSLESSGPLSFLGRVDVSGSTGAPGGPGGSVFVDVDADASVGGTLFVNGVGTGTLEVDACRVTLTGTGKIDNKTTSGDNTLLARESMKLLSGSAMTSGASGKNTLIYRTAAKPPVTSGTISPAATKVVDGSLVGCPVCGNLEIDQGETCDDGNLLNGDGCSSLCQNEKCLAQTIAPGFPMVALCEDGNLCTADFCNTTQNGGTCKHPAKNCDDAFACTTDTCNGATGSCQHATNDGACNDQNPCTNDFCSAQIGCTATNNNIACNDGDPCTTTDQCVSSVCQGIPIDGCGACGDGVTTPPEQCDDGNATFSAGEYCGVDCVLIPCGKPTNSSGAAPKSSDALFVLKAAVGQATCSPRVCDVDSSGKILASDALRVLKAAVGQPVSLSCPSV